MVCHGVSLFIERHIGVVMVCQFFLFFGQKKHMVWPWCGHGLSCCAMVCAGTKAAAAAAQSRMKTESSG